VNVSGFSKKSKNFTRNFNRKMNDTSKQLYQLVRHSAITSPDDESRKKTRKSRIGKYGNIRMSRRGACIRQRSNIALMSNKYVFDSKTYDAKIFHSDMKKYAPKLQLLLNKIRELDAADFAKTGHYFKHFIYSDIDNRYGAKIIASAMLTEGYKFALVSKKPPPRTTKSGKKIVTKRNRLVLVDPPKHHIKHPKSLVLLSSSPVYGLPMLQSTRKEIINSFNDRNHNVHGERARFLIADSGFKEGVSLFDVKYCHIFEPLLTEDELQQAIGRVRRFCGHSGLKFAPTQGWTLNVFMYNMNIDEKYRDKFGGEENLHAAVMRYSGLDVDELESEYRME
jgi:hypothetical protein